MARQVHSSNSKLQYDTGTQIPVSALSDDGTYLPAAGGTVAGTLTLSTVAVLTEQALAPAAPAANGVIIYAVDNGSGKTQLMAIFASGAAQQIAIQP